MVKLATTIGSSDIARSQRQLLHMGGHVLEVRQNLYSDYQEKDAAKLFPFSDIQYSGADVAATNSIIASCYVPLVTGVQDSSDGSDGTLMNKMPILSRGVLTDKYSPGLEGTDAKSFAKAESGYLGYGPGMADHLLGMSASTSCTSFALGRKQQSAQMHNYRMERLSPTWIREEDAGARANALREAAEAGQVVVGGNPIYITGFESEDDALDTITRRPGELIMGYVIGSRDVKMYYTEAAVAMMARNLRRIVTLLGPRKPLMMPIGLGHLATDDKGTPWRPGDSRKQCMVHPPGVNWDVGSVAYKATALRAKGSIHIPQDQVPYPTMRRNFKVNHILTQLGMEVLECASALGIDMTQDLDTKSRKDRLFECQSGSEVAALQLLFGSMFGFTTAPSPINDPMIDEASVASQVKEYIGTFFSSGHIHLDPGVFAYKAGAINSGNGLLSRRIDKGLTFKGNKYSPHGMMVEFIGRYMSFCTALAALGQYMTVPLVQAHWLYIGHPKVEYITEQMQMNFQSDVYFDGDNSLPFTLIPSRLNPSEMADRVPCYINMDLEGGPVNKYLGIRTPVPYGPVQEIRFHGDRPMTTIDEKDYTFSPVIEGDSSVITQTRNNRVINAACWPRPTHYSPGSSTLGLIYGLMHDNKRVAGHYYFVPLQGAMNHTPSGTNKYYRAMGMGKANDPITETSRGNLHAQLEQGFDKKAAKRQRDYFDKRTITPDQNPQNVDGARPSQYPLGTSDGGSTEAVISIDDVRKSRRKADSERVA